VSSLDSWPCATRARQRNIERLRSESFDLLVIGGGINGAGIAWDAAARGLKVALVEKGDFASGTSSKSSKLIHGGLRYLEHRQFRLVRQACRERNRLRKLAPHLVRPLPFLYPVYRGDRVGLLLLELGMLAYDLLASFRNIRPHRLLSCRRVAVREPLLRREGLRGAALYYDCWTDDARLTLESVLAAHEKGAVVANYVETVSLRKANGSVIGAEVRDRLTNTVFPVSARVVVNATGPWLDTVRSMDEPGVPGALRLTKGVHILVPRRRVGNRHAVVGRSPRDGRVLFIIPWDELVLVGTTDTDYEGSPDAVRAEADDIAYLLEAVNEYFPAARLRQTDVVSAYAGLRPLVAEDSHLAPSAVSRGEKIFESPSGLLSLGGGKLTTFRAVAGQVVDRAVQHLGRPELRARSRNEPFPGGRRPPAEVAAALRTAGLDLENDVIDYAVSRYGDRAEQLLALLCEHPELGRALVPGRRELWADVVFAHGKEMAIVPEDIVERRTRIGLFAPQQTEVLAEQIGRLLAAHCRTEAG